MGTRPGNPLYRLPAGVVVGAVVGLVVVVAIIVGVVGCDGGDDGTAAAVTDEAPATTTVVEGIERCLVQNPARPVRAAFQGPEAYVACARFAIHAPRYGGAGWTVARDAPAPPLAGGRRVVCELNAANAAHATIQDAGAAREGRALCRRMRREGWEPGPRP
jgi:hypothetical protein